MNDIKMVSFCVLLMFGFSFLLSIMPSQFFIPDTYDAREVPESYGGLDLGVGYAYTHIVNITTSDFVVSPQYLGQREYGFSLGGTDWVMFVDHGFDNLRFGSKNKFLGLFWTDTTYFSFKFDNTLDRGNILNYAEMNQDYLAAEGWISYRMVNPADPSKGCEMHLGFNTTLYASPEEALTGEGLTAVIGIGFNDAYTVISAWQLIASIMTFSAPNIHPVINAPLAFTLWFLFVLGFSLVFARFIPTLTGGA